MTAVRTKRRSALDHLIESLSAANSSPESRGTSWTIVRELRKKSGALVIPSDALHDLGTRNHSLRYRERKEGRLAMSGKSERLALIMDID
jgi:hypothetical protein